MSKKKEFYVVLKEQTEWKTIRDWHKGLEDARGERAKLRRCKNPMDVVMLEAFYEFNRKFENRHQDRTFGLAAVAGLLAHANPEENPVSDSFPKQLGAKKENGEPVFSKLRFYQLMKSKTLDDLYRHIRHAVMILNRNVNILSLADCVLHWEQENKGFFEKEPSRRFQFRMAQDYFLQDFKDDEDKEKEKSK